MTEKLPQNSIIFFNEHAQRFTIHKFYIFPRTLSPPLTQFAHGHTIGTICYSSCTISLPSSRSTITISPHTLCSTLFSQVSAIERPRLCSTRTYNPYSVKLNCESSIDKNSKRCLKTFCISFLKKCTAQLANVTLCQSIGSAGRVAQLCASSKGSIVCKSQWLK